MSKINLGMSIIDAMAELSEDNSGCVTFLCELADYHKGTPDFLLDLLFFDNNEIYGSKLYMLWNDCCNRNIEKTVETIKMLRDKQVSKEVIHKNLGRGRALPFEEFFKLEKM